MNLLLTSGGVSNPSIRAALVDLLGKPIEDSTALCIPTAEYGHPWCTPYSAWKFVVGKTPAPMCDLGWRQLGLLELTALPTIGAGRWIPWVEQADALLVDGGDASCLAYWLRTSGLADLLPSLPRLVWVGVSAGSMVMTPEIGETFMNWQTEEGSARPLGFVDFSIFPHLNHPDMPDNSYANARAWAREIAGPAFALDDQSAVRVVGSEVAVVSEGEWYSLPT